MTEIGTIVHVNETLTGKGDHVLRLRVQIATGTYPVMVSLEPPYNVLKNLLQQVGIHGPWHQIDPVVLLGKQVQIDLQPFMGKPVGHIAQVAKHPVPPPAPDPVAELIVRLEEILDSSYDPVTAPQQMEEDIKAVALGLLTLLRSQEEQVFRKNHLWIDLTCARCGMSMKTYSGDPIARARGCIT